MYTNSNIKFHRLHVHISHDTIHIYIKKKRKKKVSFMAQTCIYIYVIFLDLYTKYYTNIINMYTCDKNHHYSCISSWFSFGMSIIKTKY